MPLLCCVVVWWGCVVGWYGDVVQCDSFRTHTLFAGQSARSDAGWTNVMLEILAARGRQQQEKTKKTATTTTTTSTITRDDHAGCSCVFGGGFCQPTRRSRCTCVAEPHPFRDVNKGRHSLEAPEDSKEPKMARDDSRVELHVQYIPAGAYNPKPIVTAFSAPIRWVSCKGWRYVESSPSLLSRFPNAHLLLDGLCCHLLGISVPSDSRV